MLNRAKFELQMTRLIQNYGADKYNKGILKEIWKGHKRYTGAAFERLIDKALLDCKYAPKLADLSEVSEKIRQEIGAEKRYQEPPQLEYDPVFPTNEEIDSRLEAQIAENPKIDAEFVRTIMRSMRDAMIIKNRVHKEMINAGSRKTNNPGAQN